MLDWSREAGQEISVVASAVGRGAVSRRRMVAFHSFFDHMGPAAFQPGGGSTCGGGGGGSLSHRPVYRHIPFRRRSPPPTTWL